MSVVLGPDGNPLNLQRGRVVGGPKGVGDFEPFTDETVDAFIGGAEKVLESGIPLEVPMAIPGRQFLQMARTFQEMRAEIERLKGLLEEKQVKQQTGVEPPSRLSEHVARLRAHPK